MEQYEYSPMQQSNDDQQQSQNKNNMPDQGTGTIDSCTMDPCPMKEKNRSEHIEKCPDCGKTDKVETV
ncbi:MAG: hypothetical protein V4539_15975 [Bacteroidota bacterium]